MKMLLRTALLAMGTLFAMVVVGCGEDQEIAGTSSPTTPTNPPGPSSLSPAVVPTTGWRLFEETSASLTFAYPPDLTAKDISGGSARVTQFSDHNQPIRGFTVGILDNGAGLTLDEWFQEFNACARGEDIKVIVVAGQRALSCTANVSGDLLEETVALGSGSGRVIVYVSSTLDAETFSTVLSSFKVAQSVALTPRPTPQGWIAYTDPTPAFSLAYPADLEPSDISAGDQRVIQFGTPAGDRRGFAVASRPNYESVTLEQYLAEFVACVKGQPLVERQVDQQRALTCTSNPVDNLLEDAVVVDSQGRIYLITSTLESAELDAVLESFRFEG